MAISYTYVHSFKPKLNFGARIQAGYAFYFKPSKEFDTNPYIIDLINIQLLYRAKISNSLYTDLGVIASFISFTDAIDKQTYSYGFTSSLYYNYKRLHLGFSLQYRFFENDYYYYTPNLTEVWETEVKSVLLISPLIIGFSF